MVERLFPDRPKDQKTAYQRQYQRLYQRPLVQFGECILWTGPHKQRFKYEANWRYGIYLGRAMDSEEHQVGCLPPPTAAAPTARSSNVDENP
eukprot:629715-Amphidinium_carterae.1